MTKTCSQCEEPAIINLANADGKGFVRFCGMHAARHSAHHPEELRRMALLDLLTPREQLMLMLEQHLQYDRREAQIHMVSDLLLTTMSPDTFAAFLQEFPDFLEENPGPPDII